MQKKLVIPLLIIIISLAGFYFLANAKAKPKQLPLEEKILVVDALKAIPQTVTITVDAMGEVKPQTSTQVVSQISGTIQSVSSLIKAGNYVEQGTILLRVDTRDFETQLKLAQADLISAKSQLAKEQGLSEAALIDWKKYQHKKKRSKAANDLALRKPQLAEAEARLQAANANLQQAKLNLSRTKVITPYSGIITQQLVDIGQYINIGTPLFTIVATGVAELEVSIPENKLQYLNLPNIKHSTHNNSSEVSIQHKLGSNSITRVGKLTRTTANLNPVTRSLKAIIEIEDPYSLNSNQAPLLMGSFVEASIEGKSFNNIIVLPRHIIKSGNQIWVIDKNNRLQTKTIETLNIGSEYAYVTAGINKGEYICLNTITGELPGTKAKISQITASNLLLEKNESANTQKPSVLEQ